VHRLQRSTILCQSLCHAFLKSFLSSSVRASELPRRARRILESARDPRLKHDNSPFRIIPATYPQSARALVRFPLEWLGKPHGGLENITEQQNNNARRRTERAEGRQGEMRGEGEEIGGERDRQHRRDARDAGPRAEAGV
jgi:hypothetical protein